MKIIWEIEFLFSDVDIVLDIVDDKVLKLIRVLGLKMGFYQKSQMLFILLSINLVFDYEILIWFCLYVLEQWLKLIILGFFVNLVFMQ